MRLDPLVRDYPAFLDELIGVISAPTTRFYLDTSLLMWLVRLGAEPRQEFFAWIRGRPAGSVKVPVWVGHELHRHLTGKTVAANLNKTLGEVGSKYDEFVRLAAERADEEMCRRGGFPGRTDFITAVRQSHTQLDRLQKVVAANDEQLRRAAEEVIAFANERLMETDMGAVVDQLAPVGGFRYEHLIPPGYHDQKEVNRYGDLVIWEEILADVGAAQLTAQGGRRRRPIVTAAILISRDKKTDWVTGAPWVQTDPERKPEISNRDLEMDVTLPHPLLQHEFQRRTGASKVYVTHPAFLATTLDFAARRDRTPSPSKAWMAATHRPDLLVRIETAVGKMVGEPNPATAQPSALPAPPTDAAPAETASLTTGAREAAGSDVSADVRAIRDALPVDRAERLREVIQRAAASQVSGLQLGRIAAELTLAGQEGWPEGIPGWVDDVVAAAGGMEAAGAVLGILATGYFDQYGEVRDRPLGELVRIGLRFETDARFGAAFTRIGELLTEQAANLPYFPGRGRHRVAYRLDLASGPAPLRVRDVRLGDVSALADQLSNNDPRRLSALLGVGPDVGCDGEVLRSLIAREFLIPEDLMPTDWDRRKLTWSPSAGLVSLDPFSDGGLSTTSEDES
jgi:hypothetical protein